MGVPQVYRYERGFEKAASLDQADKAECGQQQCCTDKWIRTLTVRIHLSVRHFCRAVLRFIPMGDVTLL